MFGSFLFVLYHGFEIKLLSLTVQIFFLKGHDMNFLAAKFSYFCTNHQIKSVYGVKVNHKITQGKQQKVTFFECLLADKINPGCFIMRENKCYQ